MERSKRRSHVIVVLTSIGFFTNSKCPRRYNVTTTTPHPAKQNEENRTPCMVIGTHHNHPSAAPNTPQNLKKLRDGIETARIKQAPQMAIIPLV